MFKKIRPIIVSAILAAMSLSPAVYADDTDIYTTSSIVPGTPYVMLTLDYEPAAAGNNITCDAKCKQTLGITGGGTQFTRFEIMRKVIELTLDSFTNLKVGIMMSHYDSNSPNCDGPGAPPTDGTGNIKGCSNGAYVLSGFKDLGNSTERADLYAKLDGLAAPGGTNSHPYQGMEMMFEFFRYLTGQDAYDSRLGYKDFGNQDNDSTKIDSTRDLSIEVDGSNTPLANQTDIGRYVSPLDPVTDKCAKIFTVNFPMNDSADTNLSTALKDAMQADQAGGGMAGINFGPYGGMMHHTAGDWATDGPTFQNVLNWMYNIDDLADGNWGNCGNVLGKQHVTSFFVTEKGLTKAQEYANAGGTVSPTTWDYNDVDAMVSKLKSVMAQILSVSTTFTAASVPVSVLNRSQIVDNVYIALFRTDENDLARWPGNIKKLKLDSSGTILNDANDTPAIASDGRIKYDALTFWTDDTTLPTPDPNKNEVAGKDGRSVARGGAGQKIPGFTTGDPGLANSVSGARQLYYEPSSGNTLVALDADDTTKITATEESDLGASTTSEAQDLIKFARGYDMTDDDKDKVYLEARSWILGDSLHSRPLPINYGNSDSSKDPDIRLLMGTNDGFMHMFKNTDPGTTGTQLGTEVWAYMPRAVMGVVKTLKSDLAGTHPYGVDGPPAAYLYDKGLDGVIKSSDGDKVWLYFGLRRGGKAYYGLDISAPDAPTKLWTITNTGDFSELGLSFSQPRVEDLDWGSGTKPVVLFGGGYDTNKDTRTVDATSGKPTNQAALGTDDTVGNAIYIVDAQTGALVWKATQGTSATASYDSSKLTYFLAKTDMTDSIPSTLTTLDTDNDGLVDRAYVGDTGGNIWRVDMGDKDRSNWTVVKLANLGRHFNNTAKTDIRFFHRPDFVQYKDGTGAYDAVIVGSGDRANPLDTTRENWMFMIKDRFTTSGTPPTSVINFDDLADVTSSTVYNCLKTSCATAPDLAYGWKLQLESSGEKALATPTTISSQVYFTTYVPADIAAIKAKNSCDPSEGSGRLYAVSLAKAFAVNDYSVDNGTTKGKEDRYVDLKSGGIPAEVVYIPFNKILKPDLTVQNVNTTARWKSYWYPSEK